MDQGHDASDPGQSTAVRVRSAFQRHFEAGDTIFREGARGDRLYVIQAGEVELIQTRGGAPRRLARLGPGEFFGDLAVVTGRPYETRAAALCRATLLELDRATLEAMCVDQPAIAMRLIRELATRLVDAEQRQAAQDTSDLLRPVVRALVRRAGPATPEGVPIPGTLRSLAADAGLSLLETHRALHQLFDRKVVDLVDDRLVARDLEALSACLD